MALIFVCAEIPRVLTTHQKGGHQLMEASYYIILKYKKQLNKIEG